MNAGHRPVCPCLQAILAFYWASQTSSVACGSPFTTPGLFLSPSVYLVSYRTSPSSVFSLPSSSEQSKGRMSFADFPLLPNLPSIIVVDRGIRPRDNLERSPSVCFRTKSYDLGKGASVGRTVHKQEPSRRLVPRFRILFSCGKTNPGTCVQEVTRVNRLSTCSIYF